MIVEEFLELTVCVVLAFDNVAKSLGSKFLSFIFLSFELLSLLISKLPDAESCLNEGVKELWLTLDDAESLNLTKSDGTS